MSDDQISTPAPPTNRFRLTLTVTGNTLEEIESELGYQARGAFLIGSDYYKRTSWTIYGGTYTSVMEELNPDMTPERYARELDAWSQARSAARHDKEARA